MPSVSKKQQKFMGIVRSIQKGEQPASKFSKDAQDAAKKMKKSSVKKYAKTKHDDLPTKKLKEGAYKSATKNELAQYIINLNNMLAVAKSKKMTNHIKFIQQDIKDVKKALSKKKNESVKESTSAYKKSLEKIAKDRQLKMLSKKDKETLLKIAKMMKEGVNKFKKLPGKVVAKRMMSIKSLKPYASMIAKKKSVSTIDLERELPYDKVSVKDIDKVMKESLSKSQIKKMRDEFDKTGELPPHLKKVVKGKKEFEKKFKVKDIVIPGMEWMSKLGEERDYKDEYKKFQSSTKSKKYRAELNKYNRDKGTYGNGDGKDASHKGGKIVGFEKESKNRGRAEKSRLKKENNMPDFNPIIDEVLDEVFGEYQMNENSKVLKSIENLAKQNKYGNVTGTKMNGKTANLIMKIYNHPKMKKYQKAMEKYTSDELVDMTLKMPKVLGIKENVDEAAMELNKIKDAILMFQKKIKKQGRVTNARDEDHLKNLIKVYKQMGGKGVKESVNEGQKKQASMILRKFDMAYIKFSQEVRDVMKLMDKSTGSKVDGKIINKAYGKHLIPFDDLMQSWAKGQQENPGLSEDETLEGLGDKFGKKLDKYNKKNKKSKDALKKYAKLKKK